MLPRRIRMILLRKSNGPVGLYDAGSGDRHDLSIAYELPSSNWSAGIRG
jgi:hypothetical protein